jgi:signal transduction histidine kinase
MDHAASDASHLVRQQAAVHRVATLVARQRPSAEVFKAVTEEVGRLLEVEDARLVRFEDDATATVVASWGELVDAVPDGTNKPLAGNTVLGAVQRTGKAARLDSYDNAEAELVRFMKDHGVRASVAGPVVVDGAIWGAVVVATTREGPLPPDAEARIAQFTELVSTSISILATGEKLAASRARIVQATDAARRRFERDLHDGVQQRIVALGLQVRAIAALVPADLPEVTAQLEDLGRQLDETLGTVQELARGIHPAILSRGGLGPALRAVAARAGVPATVDAEDVGRLDERIEVAAYYVVSEALANAAKHARPSSVAVTVRRSGDVIEVAVADDGRGGADASAGSGLVGLADRVEAIGGTLTVESEAGAGTTVRARLPASPA